MKPFRFRAAKLLEWRELQSEAAQQALASARGAARETEQRHDAVKGRWHSATQAYDAALVAREEAGELAQHRVWIRTRADETQHAARLHAERLQAVDAAVVAAVDANRHVKVMERLQARARRRYDDVARKAEMKALDELAVLRHAMRTLEGGSEHER